MLAVLLLLSVTTNICWSETYPSKPVEFVVHTPPGSGTDLFARLIADIIKKENLCSQPVVVANKPGGGGAVALNYVAERKDSHILQVFASTSFLSSFMKSKIQADRKDFRPIAMLGEDLNVIAVNTASPYKDVKKLLEEAKKNPKKLTAGFGNIGGTGHILAYMLGKQADVKFNYLAHKNGNEAVISLLAGRVAMVTENPSEMIQHVKAGKLKIVGIPALERHPELADVPTLKEMDLNVVLRLARGVAAFKGISDQDVSYWAALFKKVYEHETFQNYMKENMLRMEFMTGSKFSQLLDEKYEMLKPLIAEIMPNK